MKKIFLIKLLGLLFFILIICFTAVFYFYPTFFWQFRIQYLMGDCKYSSPVCKDTEYCVQYNYKQGKCFPKSHSMPEIIFPKNLDSPNVCSQGNLTNEDRTHSYLNTGYAVDLSTSPNHPNAKIRAVFNGKAVVHIGCENKDGEILNDDPCGQGFGNWVALFDEKSQFIAFYAHLRTVEIKTGEIVQVGQIIGEEGKTGRAGHRHLHFSVHENIFGIRPNDMEKYGAWLPPSIPFKVKIRNESDMPVLKTVLDLPCLDSNDLNRKPFYGAF